MPLTKRLENGDLKNKRKKKMSICIPTQLSSIYSMFDFPLPSQQQKKNLRFFIPHPYFSYLRTYDFSIPKEFIEFDHEDQRLKKIRRRRQTHQKGGAHDYWPVGNGVNEIQFASCRLKLKTLNPLLSLFDQLTKRIMSSSTNLINFFFFYRFIRTVSRFY